MKETIGNVILKLNTSNLYKTAFKKAYNIDSITDQYMLKAIGQFLGMLVSSDTKYDKVYTGKATFTSSEAAGYSLFKTNCISCHSEPLTTDFTFRNNGLDELFTDNGRGNITQNAADIGKFRVPNLRNVAITYPYMHDGRFFTLTQVIDHYSNGIKHSSTIDPLFQNTTGFNFSSTEKLDLIAFLKTLTDNTYLSNPLFQK
jgi:cytochrome c peroxidase